MAGHTAAQAAVWTDQADYPPGSVVTIHGDNSDGAGYQPGETVHVGVNGPGPIAPSCDATADGSGAWSCQITLGTGVAAVGEYIYTATGQSSGVSQSGMFTDSACPASGGVAGRPTDPNVSASFTTSGNTATYTITTPNESPSGGIPGLIEYCVYPAGGSLPSSQTASYDSWAASTDSAKSLVAFERPGGDPTNLPFDGSTRQVGTATWSGTAPASQTILLHINDPSECAALGLNSQTCYVFPGTGNKDLKVTKTATPSFTRTYTWDIHKSVVGQNQQNIPGGGSATFNYTVAVSNDGYTDSAWQVTGKITVANPNTTAFTGVNVTDSSDQGGNCAVAGGAGVTVPASGSAVLDYTCTYSSAPTSAVNDTATAAWDKTAFNTPDGSASGTATAGFSTATPTIVDGSVTVTDTLGGTLGTMTYADTSPKTFSYQYTFSGDQAGTCTTHDNTATFTTDTTKTTGNSSQQVTVCVGADLVVSKDANPSFTRTYTWGITKSVDQNQLNVPIGTPATFNYTVSVTHDSGTDSQWLVTGTIKVHNPNNWESVPLTGVTDSINNGGACTITSGDPTQTIAAGDTVDLGYTCTYASAPSPAKGINTATAFWDATAASTPGGYASGTAIADFGSATPTLVNDSVTVTDTLGGVLGTVYSTDSSPKTFTYPISFNDPAGTCTTHDNIATFTTDTTGTTGTASQGVTVCVGADLKVTKDATPSFTRTFTWGITKNVDKTEVDTSGSATFNYTVSVAHDGGTDSGWQVNGTIHVANPNDWEAVTANVSDAIGNGGSCTVNGGSSVSVPASGSVDLPYTCTYASAPSPLSFTNTATAAWDKTAYSTPHDTATGHAAGAFTSPTTVVDSSVTVTDSLGGTLGTVNSGDPSPTTFTYSHTFSGDPAGTCTNHNNTATFTTSDTGTTGSDSKTVKVCVGADLVVAKTATPSFTRTYAWGISKKVAPILIEQTGGGTASASYTVIAKETGFTDSGWQVAGDITVANPNDWETVTANVTDLIDNNGTCTVNGGTGVTVPRSGGVSLPYTCTYTSAPSPASGTNTATATWDSTGAFTPHGSAQGTAAYAFGAPTVTVNKTITVTDTFNGGTPTTLGTLTATDATPFTSHTYTYSRSLNVPASNCVTYPNRAKIVETGQHADASVEACGPAKTGALTMGFWQNKNGQGIITSGASTGGVCNSGTWLRQYAPFQDLSATASCSQVATYVSTIIKAANASGPSMNVMLKAQMLSSALDAYFSDSSLGGNKINAPAAIGGVTVDLTKVCAMLDGSGGTATCSGSYENVSGAFGGATSLTVSQMLSYAASQSNAGGSLWYGQVKATQGLAKDAFDAINNQAVFSP